MNDDGNLGAASRFIIFLLNIGVNAASPFRRLIRKGSRGQPIRNYHIVPVYDPFDSWFFDRDFDYDHPLVSRRAPSNTMMNPSSSPFDFAEAALTPMFDTNTMSRLASPRFPSSLFMNQHENRYNFEVANTDTEFQFSVDVPGVNEKDLSVEIKDDGSNQLTIKGKRTVETKTSRSKSSFQRSFYLDDKTVDVEHLTATLRNGVLTVTAPKLPPPAIEEQHGEEETKKSRTLPIVSASASDEPMKTLVGGASSDNTSPTHQEHLEDGNDEGKKVSSSNDETMSDAENVNSKVASAAVENANEMELNKA
jgi:HSP20 family protein